MDDSTKVPDSFDSRDVRIADLEKQLAAALKRIAQLEDLINRLQRGDKRQAAPFFKGLPKPDPKKPGHKSGDGYGTPPVFRAMPEPSPADQVIDVRPPEVCLHCRDRSAVIESIDQQVQRDIDVRTVVRRFSWKRPAPLRRLGATPSPQSGEINVFLGEVAVGPLPFQLCGPDFKKRYRGLMTVAGRGIVLPSRMVAKSIACQGIRCKTQAGIACC